jgi:hypothetical protein
MCPRGEAFFRGAAGPGKTEALLMGALQHDEFNRTTTRSCCDAAFASSTSPTPSCTAYAGGWGGLVRGETSGGRGPRTIPTQLSRFPELHR